MRIAFRVDASFEIGSGHVMRCLTLANACRERGAEVTFFSRQHNGNLNALISQRGFEVCALATPSPTPTTKGRLDHASWLGETVDEDAAETGQAITRRLGRVDWLIVDHYSIDASWEKQLRPLADKIMVIDDIADRLHDCEVLLDQNLVESLDTRYLHLVPEHCTKFLGPRFALLQPVYARIKAEVPLREGQVQKVFAYFGATDPMDLAGLTIDAFVGLKRSDIALDIVLGTDESRLEAFVARIAQYPNIRLHTLRPSLAEIMMHADLAVGASGATSWERICLGLPTLAVVMAENQRPIAEELERRGLTRLLGDAKEMNEKIVSRALSSEISTPGAPWFNKSQAAIVDGLGAIRVADALVKSSN